MNKNKRVSLNNHAVVQIQNTDGTMIDAKPISDHEDHMITRDGQVYSVLGGGKFLKSFPNNVGYKIVMIGKKGFLVHRLVAAAFCENASPSSRTEVNHKNKDRSDCRDINLEWVTPAMNDLHKKDPLLYEQIKEAYGAVAAGRAVRDYLWGRKLHRL